MKEYKELITLRNDIGYLRYLLQQADADDGIRLGLGDSAPQESEGVIESLIQPAQPAFAMEMHLSPALAIRIIGQIIADKEDSILALERKVKHTLSSRTTK